MSECLFLYTDMSCYPCHLWVIEMTFPRVITRFLSAREKDDRVRGTYPKVLVPGGGWQVLPLYIIINIPNTYHGREIKSMGFWRFQSLTAQPLKTRLSELITGRRKGSWIHLLELPRHSCTRMLLHHSDKRMQEWLTFKVHRKRYIRGDRGRTVGSVQHNGIWARKWH